jgi:hypothetical protein
MNTLKKIRRSPTFRLRKRPATFLGGIAAVLVSLREISNNYNRDNTDNAADYNSLYSDWLAVGNDINFALNTHATHHTKSKQVRINTARYNTTDPVL